MQSETLLDTWRGLVARGPDKLAVIDGGTGRAWTRAELAGSASRWLAALPAAARGRLWRRRVVIAEPNGPQWFQVFLGLLEAGAVPAPADSKEAPERIAEIAKVAHAAAVWRENRLEFAPASAGAGADAGVSADAGVNVKADASARVDARACAKADARARLRRDDLCLVKLTSGSTGAPRALDFTHAQMLADGRQVCAAMRIGADDLNLAVIPLGHSYGLGNLVVPLLDQGSPALCPASPFPQALAEDCARWRPAVFPAVPVLLRALARSDIAPEKLASLRTVVSAGAPLAPDEAAAFAAKFGRRVHVFYGTSETGGIAYDAAGGAAEDAPAGGCKVGRLIPGVSLRWRRGKRFLVESPAVRGRGSHSPPDRGALNARGELVLLGRAGRMLKIAGRRLDPAEVENALRALPGVRDVFVAAHPARPDALAAVVASDDAAPVVAEWRARLAQRMAAWKIPDKIHIVPALPVTQRGKPDRAALSRLLARA
jgi:acyl-CoA synthetase (AMP-forming)/AMP-acid ligase II